MDDVRRLRITPAHRPRHGRDFLASLVGTVERWLHFARRAWRRAETFSAMSLKGE